MDAQSESAQRFEQQRQMKWITWAFSCILPSTGAPSPAAFFFFFFFGIVDAGDPKERDKQQQQRKRVQKFITFLAASQWQLN